MARFRKTLYLIVEGCVLVTLSVTAGVLVLHENVFRQLSLIHIYIYLALVIMSFILMEIRLGIMYLIRRGQTLIRRYIILYMTLQKV